MSNLPEMLRSVSVSARFELRKIFRRRFHWVGAGVVCLLTALCALAFYMRRIRRPDEERLGRLVSELVNGVSFSLTVLLPAAYILLPMLVGIFSAGLFAGEMANGQTRTVLLRPVPRWSLLSGKFLAMVFLVYWMLAALLLVSYGCGAALFGSGGDILVFGPMFMGRGAGIFIMPGAEAWRRLPLCYFFAGYAMISVAAMFMMFAVICRRLTTAIVVPLGIYYTCYILGALPFMQDITRFLPNRYLMIWKYCMAPKIKWDDMAHDSLFLIAYTVVYLVIAAAVFNRRDV